MKKRIVAIGVLKGNKKRIRHSDDCILLPIGTHTIEKTLELIKSINKDFTINEVDITTHGKTERPLIADLTKIIAVINNNSHNIITISLKRYINRIPCPGFNIVYKPCVA